MRLALQATFDDLDGTTDESRRRRARCERELEQNRRSFAFYRKLGSVVDDPNVKAPEVFAQESFPDPNVVAEYLDYRSESEEVATEYERVCWDSPEALAEVGDCYDILVNDLPKEIVPSKNCRRRLYYVAWEESASSSQGGENCRGVARDAYVSDDDFEETQTFEEKKKPSSSRKKEEKRGFKKDSEKTIVTSKQESDVQRTMRKERSVKRRLRGYAINAIALLCVLSFGIWALHKTRDGRRSETFQLATEQESETNRNKSDVSDAFNVSSGEPTVANSNYFDVQSRADEDVKRADVPTVADLRVGADVEREENGDFDSAPDWIMNSESFGASNDDVLAITHVDEEPTDEFLPGVSDSSGFADYQNPVASPESFETVDERSEEPKRERGGLRGLNKARRRSVEIPEQNNDVFAPTRFY